MDYNYHFTDKTNIDSIAAKGLVPMYGKNSKIITSDKRKFVFFSEGMANTIFFNCCYRNVLEQQAVDFLDSYLFDNIYLRFKLDAVNHQLSFSGYNNYTDQKILAKYLEICALQEKKTNLFIASHEYFLLYLMSQIDMDKMLGKIDDVDSNICILKLYTFMCDRLNKFNSEDYRLRFIPLQEFVADYEEREKSIYNYKK